MGSEAVASPPSSSSSRSIKFHLTGFKKFHNVDDNPTEVLMHMVPKFMKNRATLQFCATIESCTVLETAGIGALEFLLELLNSSSSSSSTHSHNSDRKATAGTDETDGGGGLEQVVYTPRDSGGVSVNEDNQGQKWGQVPGVCKQKEEEEGEVVIWVHFGVNSGASRFSVEQRAVNEATFRCRDEMGWQPNGIPIVEEDGPVSKARESVLPTGKIVAELVRQGFDTFLSWDAGRFVCNYVYYHSLRHAAHDSSRSTRSLFVHVPPFSVIDAHTQLEFVAALLQLLATYSSSPAPSPSPSPSAIF